MDLYKSTGCKIILIGYLIQVPMLQNDALDYHQYHIEVERKRLLHSHVAGMTEEKIEHYFIRVNHLDLQRIIKFGFLGMLLSVTGDLHSSEIIAEKIDFIVIPQEGSNENRGYVPSLFATALSYVH
ncbi:MAG: hypothetical protein A3E82_05200 [Gammaproteobacteria bacterium RIFCSPHIGHO2_12_FULL_38_11]|nr:MAG: hypothetical protein A3E82_05200 [Gammaproteobacteria bacterium RIFCSPHIGHO2_12_FULL_38_11]